MGWGVRMGEGPTWVGSEGGEGATCGVRRGGCVM